MDAQEKIVAYIMSNRVGEDQSTTLQNNDRLGLDSLGIVRFVAFLEQEFEIRVEDEELIPENFERLNQVLEMLERKKQPA